eukprot:CAMPEP_0171229230 /NCGR_PEP_ID=MMETSP0790-20130122/38776_1 /TAXON_ID=2925 /ORGANISM="Alexandrium catenella, Strain OF101" /LENGTH=135 /DNA_ID=CAMNT_0011695409 /DNA_START=82 /DNA_END=489 /DNA_ORIENTATION=-
MKYSPAQASKLSEEEVARYKAISAEVSAKGKDKSADAKAAAERIEAAVTSAAADAKKNYGNDEEVDEIQTSDADFVGIVVSSEAVSGGELNVNLDDVYFEEPKVVVEEEEEEANDDERSLWGDGDNDPADEKADD